MNERLEDATQQPAAHAPRQGRAGGSVSWVTAHRLLAGQPAGPGADSLRALLTSACAPATAAERSHASLNVLLDTYRQTVITPPAPSEARPVAGSPGGRIQRRVGRAMVLKCTGVLLVAAGTGAAAAGTDMLPASIQRVAHHYFGGIGIPAPSATPGSPSAPPHGSPSARPHGPASPPARAIPIGDLITLCTEIPRGSKSWRAGLDAADQAKLSAAAGGDQKVTPYCAQLLAGTGTGSTGTDTGPGSGPASGSGSGRGAGSGEDAAPTPGATDAGAANASPQASPAKSRENGKDTRSPAPNPHSTATNH